MAKWKDDFNFKLNLAKHQLLWHDPKYRDEESVDSFTSLADGITEVMETNRKALAHLIFAENQIEVETSAEEWLGKVGVMAGDQREFTYGFPS